MGLGEVMGMITSCILMLASSDYRARGSDRDDYVSLDATRLGEVMEMIVFSS